MTNMHRMGYSSWFAFLPRVGQNGTQYQISPRRNPQPVVSPGYLAVMVKPLSSERISRLLLRGRAFANRAQNEGGVARLSS
jgi:hypothetical protein